MRETCKSGSEGGGGVTASPYPYPAGTPWIPFHASRRSLFSMRWEGNDSPHPEEFCIGVAVPEG